MNTKKILGIFICMLVMTMIPVAAGATVNQTPQPTKIGWTTVQGITLTQPKELNGGALISFRCLFVHYVCQTLTQRTTGFRYGGQEMIVPGSWHGLISNHVILGWFPGALEF
jgi:hypothetical protein